METKIKEFHAKHGTFKTVLLIITAIIAVTAIVALSVLVFRSLLKYVTVDNIFKFAEYIVENGTRNPGYVYVMTDGRYTKIGLSKHPEIRRKQIGHDVKIIATKKVKNMYEAEKKLHRMFIDKRIPIYRGSIEWFDINPYWAAVRMKAA